jgi:serine/threonine-protein kinase haspin
VLWIKFLFGYVKNNFKDSKGNLRELAHFEVETSEMKRRLDPRTLVKNGAFSSAKEIYQYVVEQGWITAEQLAKMTEASFLSDTVDADPSQEAVKE